ncbi:hypothetical protein BOSEA31B_14650 [Hyphomicrobiales bacterium]|nr:hypothetical protein BOSEA31B_14650 [Hyphomicrobiales bacterium]
MRMRIFAELRGSSASFRRARKRSSMGWLSSLAIARRRARRPANFFTSFLRRSLFSTELFLAIDLSWFPRMNA